MSGLDGQSRPPHRDLNDINTDSSGPSAARHRSQTSSRANTACVLPERNKATSHYTATPLIPHDETPQKHVCEGSVQVKKPQKVFDAQLEEGVSQFGTKFGEKRVERCKPNFNSV